MDKTPLTEIHGNTTRTRAHCWRSFDRLHNRQLPLHGRAKLIAVTLRAKRFRCFFYRHGNRERDYNADRKWQILLIHATVRPSTSDGKWCEFLMQRMQVIFRGAPEHRSRAKEYPFEQGVLQRRCSEILNVAERKSIMQIMVH